MEDAGTDSPATSLSRLVSGLSGLLTGSTQLPADPAIVTDIVIAEPGNEADLPAGALVLAIGALEESAAALVREGAKFQVAAVVVKTGPAGLPAVVREAADEARLPVLGIVADARWDKVEALARAALDSAGAARGSRDLFSLAHTVAALTGGAVTIEDTANHVVAYSQTGAEADDVRRQTILGRNCPEPYLAILRQLGVFQRVRSGEDVVEVPAHPELGARRRMVTGVHAGSRPLGTIWVQEGGSPLSQRTSQVLTGAARIAAPQLIEHYYRGDGKARTAREDLAEGLLTGRFNAASLAVQLGVDPDTAAWVVAVDLREPPGTADATWLALRRSDAADIIAVHAAGFRRDALVVQACGQIYLILPEPSPSGDEAALTRWVTQLVEALRRHTGTPVQAAVAGLASRLDAIPAAKMRGWKTLNIMAGLPDQAVGSAEQVRAALILDDMLAVLREHPGARDPRVTELVRYDADRGSELARSLLAYLDAFGDVGNVAAALHVHPNTLRQRIRRAADMAGLDLADPAQRLVAMIQLRLMLTGDGAGQAPFPTGAVTSQSSPR